MSRKLANVLLHSAVEDGDVRWLELLLFNGPEIADVNYSDHCETTVLSVACKKGDLETVNLLMDHPEIDVNKADIFHRTPFFYAVQHNHLSVVKRLLQDPRVDPNVPEKCSGATAIHLMPLMEIEMFKLLVDDERVDVNTVNIFREPPLIVAIINNRTDFIRRLLVHPKISLKSFSNIIWFETLCEQTPNFQTILAFQRDPGLALHMLRVKYGITDDIASSVFSLIIFQCEGLLALEE